MHCSKSEERLHYRRTDQEQDIREDEQLIAAVNTAFGTTLNAEDFTKPSPCAPVSSANIACSVRMNRQTSAYGVNLLRMLLDMNLITEGEYEKITRISAEYYDTEVVCV